MDLLDEILSGVGDISDPAMEGVTGEDGGDDDFQLGLEGGLTLAVESAVFIDDIIDSFGDDVEACEQYIGDHSAEWELHGLIEDSAVAMEAVKRIQIDNWKQVNFERLWKRQALRQAAAKNNQAWKKYHYHREEMRKYREEIFQREGPTAKRIVKQSRNNSRQKAAVMKTAHGKDLQQRLNNSMSKSKAGHNPTSGSASNAK